MSLCSQLTQIRMEDPERILTAYRERTRMSLPANKRILVIACDHPARGALGAGPDPLAMASREELLARCIEALSRPGVDGFLGTPDMVEDLLLLGALDNKIVFGSMNRGGIAGAQFEMDDRLTGYDADSIVSYGLEGGKMLTRINLEDPATVTTLETTARTISDLADHQRIAMIEPFISVWHGNKVVNDLRPESVIRSIAIAEGLGHTSAYTWLKLPCVAQMDRVMAATSLPSLILGGEVSQESDRTINQWADALTIDNVRGLVVGRSLLFPPHGDVARAVDNAVELL